MLWEYVIRADDSLNLADLEAGWKWFHLQNWCPRVVTESGETYVDGRDWEEREQKMWLACVRSLRSVVARLTRRQPKQDFDRSERGARRADKTLAEILALMRPMPHGGGRREPLSRANFTGIVLQPTVSDGGESRPVQNPRERFYDNTEVFWQSVFHSIFVADMEPICSSCGGDLPRSKGGKPSRRTRCKACQWRIWNAKQSRAKKREKWRADKAQQRKHQ